MQSLLVGHAQLVKSTYCYRGTFCFWNCSSQNRTGCWLPNQVPPEVLSAYTFQTAGNCVICCCAVKPPGLTVKSLLLQAFNAKSAGGAVMIEGAFFVLEICKKRGAIQKLTELRDVLLLSR